MIFRGGSPVLTNIASSASAVTLAPAKRDRSGLIIYNDSSAILYIKYGATASTSSFTVAVPSQSVWVMPNPIVGVVISGIWASANGFARVTEV